MGESPAERSLLGREKAVTRKQKNVNVRRCVEKVFRISDYIFKIRN